MNTHLTTEQKQMLRDLITNENLRDVLSTIAGIVSHDVTDYTTAIDASSLIRKAAILVSNKS